MDVAVELAFRGPVGRVPLRARRVPELVFDLGPLELPGLQLRGRPYRVTVAVRGAPAPGPDWRLIGGRWLEGEGSVEVVAPRGTRRLVPTLERLRLRPGARKKAIFPLQIECVFRAEDMRLRLVGEGELEYLGIDGPTEGEAPIGHLAGEGGWRPKG